MQFLYTGASAFQGTQNDPNNSLGGLISNSVVSNNKLSNLFNDFSWQAVQEKRTETRALVLQNVLGFDCTDVLFGYVYPTTPSATFDLQIAFVALTEGATSMERIPNGGGTPIYATFEEANIDPSADPPVNNSIDIGALASNAMIGIWLQLRLLAPLTPPTFNTVDDEITWWKNISQVGYSILQNIQLKIEYTYNT